ncbi:MAG: AAA family ATPase, partial [Betaproteobacteria bacterium]
LTAVDTIETWANQEHARLTGVFARRKREGRVRECHGDLHLRNIVYLDGELRPFDCIEFNPDLRWIDVMNEVAFMVMDLYAADRPDLARRFLNAYLESCGDYDGLRVLAYYVAYRAMVRAKINLMRVHQIESASEGTGSLQERCGRYLDLALSCTRQKPGFIAITRGFSGSGKTTLSQSLIELSGAIRIRSDIERKRLQGMAANTHQETLIDTGIYAQDVTESTYRHLLDLAHAILESGHGVIVDATFLQRRHRDWFSKLAAATRVPFAILDFSAPEALLRERIAARSRQGDDASDADLVVLEHQLRTAEPLQPEELAAVFAYDAARPVADAQRPQSWAPLLRQLLSMPASACLSPASDQA